MPYTDRIDTRIIRCPAVACPLREAAMAAKLVVVSRPRSLTRRQRVVVSWLPTGLPAKAIGVHLCIAEGTVKGHIAEAKRRMGFRTRSELVVLAIQNHWEPD